MALSGPTPDTITARVITLPDRPDRRAQFAIQAAEQGLRFTWVDGIRARTPAEGINQAHRCAVRMAMDAGEPFALVMEDDALFTAPDAYAYFLRNMPEDFDLYLAGIYGGAHDEDGVLRWWSGMHCYVVAARFYERFLAVHPHTHIDAALSRLEDRTYHVCRPYPCMQRSGFSDNEGREMDYASWAAGRTYKGPTRP